MHSKDLFFQLTLKELKARYKQSVLGYAWAILVPLINLLVLSVIFSNLFRVFTSGIPYPVFLFVALVPWIFFSNAISFATGSVTANSSLITKIKLPREILPLTAVASKIIDLFLTSLVLILFLVFYKISPNAYFFFLPVIFLIQLMLILGVSFFLSAINVFFRDIENILGVILMVWMYLTPVIYSYQMIPDKLVPIFFLNPMTGIINSYRDVILYGKMPDLIILGYTAFVSLIILILGYFYFRERSKFFADVI